MTCILLAGAITGCRTPPPPTPVPALPVAEQAEKPPAPLTRLAFGSCAHQDRPQPFWQTIQKHEPNLFVFLGDTVYADTHDMTKLAATYAKLGAIPEYLAFRRQCPVLAIWDDHDYGVNDGGKEFPFKQESKTVFLDFFHEPEDSSRRDRPGNYGSVVLGPPGQRVQIILLDTRWFRDDLHRLPLARPGSGQYMPTPDEETALLGEAQWAWLAGQLQQPAEFRILASSIQVVSDEHNWEKWDNFPHERQRLFRLLRESGTTGLIILSGDRHRGECSRMDAELGYPLYDLTSSGLNMKWENGPPEANRYRISDLYEELNYGLLTFDWQLPSPALTLELRHAETDDVLFSHRVNLSELEPGSSP